MNSYINFFGLFLFLVSLLGFSGCEPYEAEDIELPAAPIAGFTYEYVTNEPNRVVFKSTGEPGFLHLWDFGNGNTSSILIDTAYFPVQGDYDVTLTVAGRGGTGSATQTVNIAQSDGSLCNDDYLIWLTGGCGDADGKKWNLSTVAGAVIVGPSPGSDEWYSSPEDGLVDDQKDDVYHFVYTDNKYNYLNNGMTIFPECGYIPKPFTADPNAIWSLSPGTGWSGSTQLILPEGSFIGTKDSGPIYDILSISEEDMLLQSELLGGSGYFRFILSKVE